MFDDNGGKKCNKKLYKNKHRDIMMIIMLKGSNKSKLIINQLIVIVAGLHYSIKFKYHESLLFIFIVH